MPPPPIETGAAGDHPPAGGEIPALEDMIIRSSAGIGAWFEGYAVIRKKDGAIEEALLNPLQQRVCAAIEWCLDNRQPVRLIILKPRQKGSSTISVAAIYWFMCRYAVNGVVIGGQYDEVDNMWEILKRYAKEDLYDWGFNRLVQEFKAKFGNGAKLEKETARDENAGRSGTFQAMLATEAARWKDGKSAPPEKVITGILHCLPDLPETIAILDSTANGPEGFYYDKWQDAVTLEDRMAGRMGNGWIRIFAGWHEFEDSVADAEERGVSADTYNDKEKGLALEYGLTPEQIAYRRKMIDDNCGRDPAAFDMDFPGCPADAFRASSRTRFTSSGLSYLRGGALKHRRVFGVFDRADPDKERYVWRAVGEGDHHDAVIFEPPVAGCRYLLAVDVMTGEFAAGSDPDNHAGLVLRDGYWDSSGRWRPPKLAARTAHPCRWDIDLLEEVVWRLACHYGRCMIVPEENMDRGLIRGLDKRGANIYQRDEDGVNGGGGRKGGPGGLVRHGGSGGPAPGRASKRRLGFKTLGSGKNARHTIIDHLSSAVRDWGIEGSGIEVPDLVTVGEMENFITAASGRSEAAPGKHDDCVMALAIGLATIACATVYRPGERVRDLPPDILELERARKGGGGGMYS